MAFAKVVQSDLTHWVMPPEHSVYGIRRKRPNLFSNLLRWEKDLNKPGMVDV
jgi:hypothetical protein